MAKKNRIKFGLKEVHYAVIENYDTEAKKYTYGEVKAHPGAVNLTLDAQGSAVKKFADDILYYTSTTNAGYEGDLEVVVLTEDFLKDILGEVEVEGVLIESSDTEGKEFALMFEITGDASGRRYIFWRCKASRPSVTGQTKEDSTEPQDDTITITVMPRESDNRVKGRIELPSDNTESDYDTKKAIYDKWYESVWEPKAAENGGTEAQAAKSSKQESDLI